MWLEFADISFKDEEVLSKDFQDKIKAVLDVVAPFVHMWVLSPADPG